MKKDLAVIAILLLVVGVMAKLFGENKPATELKPTESQSLKLQLAQRTAQLAQARSQIAQRDAQDAQQAFQNAMNDLYTACEQVKTENKWPSDLACTNPAQFNPNTLQFSYTEPPKPPDKK